MSLFEIMCQGGCSSDKDTGWINIFKMEGFIFKTAILIVLVLLLYQAIKFIYLKIKKSKKANLKEFGKKELKLFMIAIIILLIQFLFAFARINIISHGREYDEKETCWCN